MLLCVALIASLAAGAAADSSERAITFKSGAVVLSGSILLPRSSSPFAAVALLHGSGPQTRDWLLPIARRLAEAGAAVLVFDKRGTGRSTGAWVSASLEDLTGDVLQACPRACQPSHALAADARIVQSKVASGMTG